MNNNAPLNSLLNKEFWSKVPVGLILLMAFSGASAIFSIYLFFYASEELLSTIFPHVGLIGSYMYFIFFMLSIFLILSRQYKLRKNIIFGFIFLILYGAFNYYMSIGRDDYNNPYLTYGTYKPIWEMLLPFIWVVVLSSKAVKEYCSSNGI
jgi:hypothetical protein